MSTTSTARIRTSRFVDTLGVLAVVTGLLLGLVPGIAVPAANAAVGVSLDQCANDQNNDDVQDDCAWVNGNLNKNNSIYAEGDSVGFRARLTGLTVDAYYEVPVNYDILNSGYIAYDQITSWEHSEIGDPRAGTGVTGPEDTFTVGTDPYTQHHLGGAPTGVSNFDVSIWGGEWDTSSGAFEYVGATPPLPTGANDSVTTDVVFRFQATGESAVIAWGGHIALRQDWNSEGYDTAPQSTSGSPYHMRNGDKLGVKSNAGDPYTYSSLGNQDRSLKADAVILPGGIEIIKTNTDDPALPLTGFTYSITGPDGFSETCTTPNCTFTEVPIGTYTVTETGVSGDYVLDPTPQVLEVLEGEVTTFTFQNERIDFAIQVVQDDTNTVGYEHPFTVSLVRDDDGDGFDDTDTPLAGETVSLDWAANSGSVNDDGSITTVNGVATDTTSTTCTTDTNGECSVGVTSSTVGSGTLTATWTGMDYQHETTADPAVSATGGQPYGSIEDSATKAWIGFTASISVDDLNRINEPHTFTVTVNTVDETGAETAASGVTVDVDWTGPTGSTINAVVASSDSCTTDSNGECAFTVNSATPGLGTLEVTKISGEPVAGETQTIEYGADKPAGELSADKTWVEFRALVSGDSTNLVVDDHVFDVYVEYRATDGSWSELPDGSDLKITPTTLSGSPTASTADCDSTVAEDGDELPRRVCTVTVGSGGSAAGIKVTVAGIDSTSITANGLTQVWSVTFASDALGVGTIDLADYSSTKRWASYSLSLDPPHATNLLGPSGSGQDHDITATLSSDDTSTAPVAGQTLNLWISGGDTGTITATEGGTIAGDGQSATCTTDANGDCTITVTSSTSGTVKVDAQYKNDTVFDSGEIFVEADEATKDWTTFQVTVSPDAENLLSTNGGTHTFTVYVEQFNPDQPVEDAVLTINVVQEDPTKVLFVDDSDCTDGDNAGGLCEVHVTTEDVQRVTLTATYGAEVDSAHSETVQTADFADEGVKTWIDYRVDVTPETDTNLVDTDHTFTVTITRITPDGEGAVANGTVPSVAYSGGAEDIDFAAGTCDDGTVDGTCTVVVSTDDTGTNTLIVTYQGTASGEVGVDDTQSDTYRGTADKTWIDYRLTLDDDAVNAVGDEHTFTALLEVDNGDGKGFVPLPGTAVEVADIEGVGSIIDESCSTGTDGDGECTITINSETGGTTTVAVSYTVPQGVLGVTAEEGITFGDTAVKQWVDISLVKTAVVGDGFGDGDLVEDPDTGLPTLFFTSSDQGPKTAVFEYLITNTGGDTLFDLTLVDDRLGAIALPAGLTLEPGASTTVRASQQFTYDDAAGGLNNIIVNVGVINASGADGSQVSDTDDAVIQLIAQQSSILIDLQKDVVVGAGDVEAPDGPPTVTWSESELEAGATKVVRYAFTITNVGPSPIVDVELTDPMISGQPIISVADGVTLQPGESTVVEVDHVLTVDAAFPDGPTAGELPNVAAVSGANETRDAFDQDTDDAIVFVQVVFAEQVLPVTGLQAGGLAPLAMLLITIGAAILWLDRRRVTGRR